MVYVTFILGLAIGTIISNIFCKRQKEIDHNYLNSKIRVLEMDKEKDRKEFEKCNKEKLEFLIYLKAIIYKYKNEQINIDCYDIDRTMQYDLYIQESSIERAKLLKLVNRNNIVKEEKEND